MARIALATPPHASPPADVCARLATSRRGLSAAEAAARLRRLGPNALARQRRKPLVRVFVHQFQSPLIYLLFVAALTAYLVGEIRDAFVVLAVVFLNSIIGTFQEGRAERSMEQLRKLSQLRVRVVRDGAETVVEAHAVVPGDVVVLAAGDAVAADARLLEARGLEASEAALTGESLPVAKHTDPLSAETQLPDRGNLVFNGTHITAGRGVAVVVATGPDSEVGGIAAMTQAAREPETPLEQRIGRFGRALVVASVVVFAVILLLGWLRDLPFKDVLMVAISQVVSIVPEGLPVAVTVALAVGMQRMAARGAVVRRLAAVETLGSTTVICSDKTGTLTRNEMTVTTLALADGRRIAVAGAGYAPEGTLTHDGRSIDAADGALGRLVAAAALCNDADVSPGAEGWTAVGDPTEAALITLARKAGLDLQALRKDRKRTGEVPFDSAAKMMMTEHLVAGAPRVYLKGAPEVVLARAGLAGDALAAVKASVRAMGNDALRVLAVAEAAGTLGEVETGTAQIEFLGLVGQIDPPRDEARRAVAACRTAGIKPIMITGDHKATGLAVARSLGIADEASAGVDGHELERMSDAELEAALARVTVFARVHPEQKLRIVTALQRIGQVVAMTGDGVNDAPALATADVGVAMGITGTEVAKGAAKIVIGDDNFATIVNAVEEGRLIYANLKKVIVYLFATSADEILILVSAMLLGYPLPLAAVQILWINIVTDGAVTINLIMEPAEGDEMRRAPVPPGEPLLTPVMLRRVGILAPTTWLNTFGWFAVRIGQGVPFAQVQTETFTLLAVNQWFNVLNCRSELRSAFTWDMFRNRWLIGGLAVAASAQLAVIYWAPLNGLFHTVPLPLTSLFGIVAIATSILWVEELRKWRARKKARPPAPSVASRAAS